MAKLSSIVSTVIHSEIEIRIMTNIFTNSVATITLSIGTDRPEQTLYPQIGFHRIWHLIKVCTVCTYPAVSDINRSTLGLHCLQGTICQILRVNTVHIYKQNSGRQSYFI